jgi:acetylornithine/N-succinyldiaminopimelate aminotransferase
MTNATDPYHALMNITARPQTVFVKGEGAYLWDDKGKRYLDFMQGWAVNCLGHSPAIIADALAAQAKLLLTPSPAFYNGPSLQLAKALVANSCFDQVFFANSGAEANEGAIKLARKYGALHKGGAHEIITFVGGFHGRTLATMSASGKKAFEPLFEPKVTGFPKAQLNDLDSVKRLISEKTVAVMLEPIQGEAGVWPATDQFLKELRALTKEHGLLLIVDEIQTGMGRTGKLFHYEHAGIEPDIMTLGKGIGGGVPLAALLSKADVAVFEAGDQGGTYNGNPLMTAVGYSVISQLTAPGFLEGVRARGEYLRSKLLELSEERGFKGERGEGLLRALLLDKDTGPQIVEKARDMQPDGLLLNAARPNLLRFMPALNVTNEEIDQMMAMLRSILDSL